VPFYHCFGMVLGNLACTTHGATMVIPAEAYDPVATMETVQRERCTSLYGVPTMFIGELEHARFKEFDFSSLRTGIMAGSPCPVEVMKKVQTVMHMPEMTIAYGMTETPPSPPSAPPTTRWSGASRRLVAFTHTSRSRSWTRNPEPSFHAECPASCAAVVTS
jgi:fatty-acyl-CoA synthase